MSFRKFKILMICSECSPFAKEGDVADMVYGLSLYLDKLGHQVKIIMPLYYSIDKSSFKLLSKDLGIPLGEGREWCNLYSSRIENSHIEVLFLEHNGLYNRPGIYGKDMDSYPDNARRFTLLSKSVFEVCREISWYPDILHSHDWVAAMTSVFLYSSESRGEFQSTASVLTIHNMLHQGIFYNGSLSGAVNFLEAGIQNADIICTLSPSYAREIRGNFSHGMQDLIVRRQNDLFGILNGIDYQNWSPKTDKYLFKNYDFNTLALKKENKKVLQKQLDLPIKAEVPLICIFGPLYEHKGMIELCLGSPSALHNICSKMDLQLVVCGCGEPRFEKEMFYLQAHLPNVSYIHRSTEEQEHQVLAASDFLLMPSQEEPCGSWQMRAQAYGTLPIVRKTGGLADTVENYKEESGEGSGFVFFDLTPRAIFNVSGWAVHTYYNRKEDLHKLIKSAMNKKFLWNAPALQYSEIYQWALDRRLGIFPRSW